MAVNKMQNPCFLIGKAASFEYAAHKVEHTISCSHHNIEIFKNYKKGEYREG